MDDQILKMREIAHAKPTMLHLCGDIWWIIIHVQNHSQCYQDTTECGNVIHTCGGMVFKHLSMASSRKHRKALNKKEEVCSDKYLVA